VHLNLPGLADLPHNRLGDGSGLLLVNDLRPGDSRGPLLVLQLLDHLSLLNRLHLRGLADNLHLGLELLGLQQGTRKRVIE
jgi:hypothetical protein